MKKQILTLALVVVGTALFANYKQRPLNSIQINALGDASLLSINYEKQYVENSFFIWSCKIGLGYNEEFVLWGGEPAKYLTIPHHITGNIGCGRHFIELGLGGTILSNTDYLFYPIIGYRILPLNKRNLNLRIFGHVPYSWIEDQSDAILFIPFGLSIGYSFNRFAR